jgi:hypothetical protein
MSETRERFGQGSRACAVSIGAGSPITRNGNDNEAGIARDQRFVITTPSRQQLRGKILDDHVGSFDESAENALSLDMIEIESDRTLISGHQCPLRRRTFALQADSSERIPLPAFNLDDIRAEVGKGGRDLRGREQIREIQNSQASQRTRFRHRSDLTIFGIRRHYQVTAWLIGVASAARSPTLSKSRGSSP